MKYTMHAENIQVFDSNVLGDWQNIGIKHHAHFYAGTRNECSAQISVMPLFL